MLPPSASLQPSSGILAAARQACATVARGRNHPEGLSRHPGSSHRDLGSIRKPAPRPSACQLTYAPLAHSRADVWLLYACCLSLALASPAVSNAASLPRSPDHDYDAPTPGSYELPIIKAAADGQVLDATGRSRKLQDFTRGKITVMSFIYTRCAAAKACPYATGVLMQLHQLSQADPALANGLRLVSLSFDPENDSPQRMSAYSLLARSEKPASEWHFLTTASQEKLTPILRAYGQAVDRKRNPNDPTGPLNHTLRVFLVDAHGRIRNIYSSGTLDLRLVLADVKTLQIEHQAQHRTHPPGDATPPAKPANNMPVQATLTP